MWKNHACWNKLDLYQCTHSPSTSPFTSLYLFIHEKPHQEGEQVEAKIKSTKQAFSSVHHHGDCNTNPLKANKEKKIETEGEKPTLPTSCGLWSLPFPHVLIFHCTCLGGTRRTFVTAKQTSCRFYIQRRRHYKQPLEKRKSIVIYI